MFLAIASSHYLMFAVHFVVVGGSGKSLKLIKVREHNTKKGKKETFILYLVSKVET